MRGKQIVSTLKNLYKGITPAYAGKTLRSLSMQSTFMDHPRVCGENRPTSRHLTVSRGSPPRMRGKPVHSTEIHEHYRITPAYAGKTY